MIKVKDLERVEYRTLDSVKDFRVSITGKVVP